MTPARAGTPIVLLIAGAGLSGCALRYEVVPSDYPKIAQAHAGEGERRVRVFRPTLEDSPDLDLRYFGGPYVSATGPSGQGRAANLWTFDVDADREVYVLDRDGNAFVLSSFRAGSEGLEGVPAANPGVRTYGREDRRVSIPWTSVKAVELRRVHGGKTTGLLLGLLAAALLLATTAGSQ